MNRRWLLLLLVLSVTIRCIGLHRPLLDAHEIRQVHTAVLTKNLIEDGYPWIQTRGDWKGFENSTVVLELPIQMHVAGRLTQVVGSIEAAGRLTSIAGWIAAFLLFHSLARQLLSRFAAGAAVIIFALSPMSIFFGQSFQPETWVLFLSLAVLCSFLKWCDGENPLWLVAMTAALMLGFTLKSNEMIHLAFPLAAVGWARQGRRIFLRWQLWLVVAVVATTALAWSWTITHFNRQSFPVWTSKSLLAGFIGPLSVRFHPQFYAKLAGYMGVLGLTPVLVIFWCRGAWVEGTTRRNPLLLGWGVGIAFYYLVFGPGGPSAHSYYHLVALPWFCLLAAAGVESALAAGKWWSDRVPVRAAAIVLWLAGVVAATLHLYQPDRVAWQAARSLAELHPAKNEGVLVAADHRLVTSGFGLYPTIFFYSGTRGYNLPTADRIGAIDTLLSAHPELKWAVQTFPTPAAAPSWRDRIPFFAQLPVPQPALDEPLLARGFVSVVSAPQWRIFRRGAP